MSEGSSARQRGPGLSVALDTEFDENRGYRLTGEQAIHDNDSELHQHLSSLENEAPGFAPALQRRRDEDDGVRGTQFEESPERDPALEKPKKTLAQHNFGLKTVRVEIDEVHESHAKQVVIDLTNNQEPDSRTSTPKEEGGIQTRSHEELPSLEKYRD